MPEPLCICCLDPVTAENGAPLYLQALSSAPAVEPAAWVHKNCLDDYARPFEIADFPQSDLDALLEYTRSSNP